MQIYVDENGCTLAVTPDSPGIAHLSITSKTEHLSMSVKIKTADLPGLLGKLGMFYDQHALV